MKEEDKLIIKKIECFEINKESYLEEAILKIKEQALREERYKIRYLIWNLKIHQDD